MNAEFFAFGPDVEIYYRTVEHAVGFLLDVVLLGIR